MKKIEQELAMLEFLEQYRLIGTSCEPMDREVAKRSIATMYELIGKKEPMFFFCQSPWQAIVEINILSKHAGANLWANLGDNLRDSLWDNLGANLWANLRDNLGDNLGANLADNLADNPGDNLRDNLGDNLWANLRANLRANLGDNLGDNLWDNLWANLRGAQIKYVPTWLWGQLDSYWIVFYLFPHLILRDMHPPDQVEKLLLWDNLAKSCGWWYAYENICFICDRFESLHQDASNRLHNPNGPAMRFRDGYSVYAINGVRIPGWIVERPELITPGKIQDESNAEVRRIMIGKYGWHNYLDRVEARMIDRDADPTIGELWRWNEPDGVEVQILRCLNGTPDPVSGQEKWYSLRTELQFKRAIDANRHSFPICRDMSDEEFRTWNKYRT